MVHFLQLLFLKAACLLAVSCTVSCSTKIQCFVPGECRNSYHIDGSVTGDAGDCLSQCKSREQCAWFTFHPDNHFCELFMDCQYLDTGICPNCISGQSSCSEYPVCEVRGQCLGVSISEKSQPNLESCLISCKEEQGCTWYTYYTTSSACVLYYTCPTLDLSCYDCLSGEERCDIDIPDPEPEWHIIIGGGYGAIGKTVELFNWKTSEQCRLGDLPVTVQGHVGGSLEGRPVFCAQGASSECYALNLATMHWDQINRLLSPTSFAGTVNVPNQGLYIYGGKTSIGTTQLLHGINQQWLAGPPVFNSEVNNDGVCVVQYNDTMTVILGGRINFHAITTYDWILGKYQAHYPELSRPRKYSSCAVAKLPDGQRVIAVAGGITYNQGQGMEFWNPNDGSVTVVQEQLPPELGALTPLQDSRLLSVNHGENLLLYGGQALQDHNGIWKYSVSDNSWVQIGRMIEPREEHLVIPVENISC